MALPHGGSFSTFDWPAIVKAPEEVVDSKFWRGVTAD